MSHQLYHTDFSIRKIQIVELLQRNYCLFLEESAVIYINCLKSMIKWKKFIWKSTWYP